MPVCQHPAPTFHQCLRFVQAAGSFAIHGRQHVAIPVSVGIFRGDHQRKFLSPPAVSRDIIWQWLDDVLACGANTEDSACSVASAGWLFRGIRLLELLAPVLSSQQGATSQFRQSSAGIDKNPALASFAAFQSQLPDTMVFNLAGDDRISTGNATSSGGLQQFSGSLIPGGCFKDNPIPAFRWGTGLVIPIWLQGIFIPQVRIDALFAAGESSIRTSAKITVPGYFVNAASVRNLLQVLVEFLRETIGAEDRFPAVDSGVSGGSPQDCLSPTSRVRAPLLLAATGCGSAGAPPPTTITS